MSKAVSHGVFIHNLIDLVKAYNEQCDPKDVVIVNVETVASRDHLKPIIQDFQMPNIHGKSFPLISIDEPEPSSSLAKKFRRRWVGDRYVDERIA